MARRAFPSRRSGRGVYRTPWFYASVNRRKDYRPTSIRQTSFPVSAADSAPASDVGGGGTGTTTYAPTAGADDGTANPVASTFTSSGNPMAWSPNNSQWAYVRLPGVAVGQGETVNQVLFKWSTNGGTSNSYTVKAYAQDNFAQVASFADANATRGTASASSGASTTTAERTLDITAVIQEVVNRAGWVSGNAIGLYITSSGSVAEMNSFETNTVIPRIEVTLDIPATSGVTRSLALPRAVVDIGPSSVQIAADDFNRADIAPSTTALGANWSTTAANGLGISSNTAYAAAGNSWMAHVTPTASDSQFVQAKLSVLPTGGITKILLALPTTPDSSLVGTTTYVYLDISSAGLVTVGLRSTVGDSSGPSAATISAGDTVRAERRGATVSVYVNGSFVNSRSLSSLSGWSTAEPILTGQHRVGLYTGNTTVRFDDFAFGDLGATYDTVTRSLGRFRDVADGGASQVGADDFNRADATAAVGALGGNWSQPSAASLYLGISSNQVYPTSGVGNALARYATPVNTGNRYVQATVTFADASSVFELFVSLPSVLGTSATNTRYISAKFDNSINSVNFAVSDGVNGSATQVSVTVATNDVLRAELVGQSLVVKVNGSTIGTVSLDTLTPYKTNKPLFQSDMYVGLGLRSSTSRLDNFSFGDLGVTADLVTRLFASTRAAADSAAAIDAVTRVLTEARSVGDASGGFGLQVASDDFNRADVAPSTVALGANWSTQSANGLGISGNQVYGTANSSWMAHVTPTSTDHQFVQAKVSVIASCRLVMALNTTPGVFLTGTTTTSYVFVEVNGSGLVFVGLKTPNTEDTSGSLATISAGDVVRSERKGNVVSVYVNGSLVGSVDIATLSNFARYGATLAGQRRVGIFANAAGGALRLDDFSFGDLVTADVASRTLALPRNAADTAAATDAVGTVYTPGSGAFNSTASDAAAATDAVARALAEVRAVADTAAATDAVTRTLAQTRAIADSAPATDAVTRSGPSPQPRTTSDSAAATDVDVRSLAQARAPPDSAPATDAVVRTSSRSRSVADAAPATDAATRSLAQSRAAADSAPATDAVTRSGPSPQTRSISDSTPAVDTVARARSSARSVADSAPATDAVTRSGPSPQARSVSDSAPAVDTVARTLTQSRATADSAPASDTVTRSGPSPQPRSVSDSAPATDAVTRSVSMSRATADSAPATDTVARATPIVRPCSDSAPATDAVTRSLTQSRAIADSAPATDAVTRSGPSPQARSVSDSAPAVDTVARSLSQARSAADSAPVTDTVARTCSAPRACVDTAPAVDTVVRSLAQARSVADSAPATDAVTRLLVATASAALSAESNLTASSILIAIATAALDAVGTLLAVPEGTTAGTADLAATGALTASILQIAVASADLSATTDLTATGIIVVLAAADLSATSTLTASSTTDTSGAADLSAISTLTASSLVLTLGAAVFSATSNLTATSLVITAGSASLDATGTLTASSLIQVIAAASLASNGTLTVSALVVTAGAADLSGSGTLTAVGARAAVGAASLSATATLDATSLLLAQAQAAPTGSGTLTATATLIALASAALSATTTLFAASDATQFGQADLTAGGSLAATAVIVKIGAASLSAQGDLAADGARVAVASVDLVGTTTLSAAVLLEAVGTTSLSGLSSLAAVGALLATGIVDLSALATMAFGNVYVIPFNMPTVLSPGLIVSQADRPVVVQENLSGVDTSADRFVNGRP